MRRGLVYPRLNIPACSRAGWSCQRFALLLAATPALCTAAIAFAEDAQESIRLEYRADSGCPDEAAFVARVRERTGRARFVVQGEAERTFEVELRALPTPRGTFTVEDRESRQGTRTFEADSCGEVADALAVAVALATDPPRSEPPEPAPPAGGPPATGSAAPSTSAVPLASTTPPTSAAPSAAAVPSAPPFAATEPPLAPPPPRAPQPARAKRVVVSTPWPSSLFAGADLAVAQGVAPAVLVGPSVVVGWRSKMGSSPIGATLRASAVFAGTDPLSVPGGQAAFAWTVGRADGCLDLIPDRRFRAGACARVEAGVLEVHGADVIAPQDPKTMWMAAGAVLHADWSVLPFLFVAADAGPTFRAVAHRFMFLPDTTAYQVPVVGFDADAGLGVHFP